MVSLPPDFESGASANSTTPANLLLYYTTYFTKNQELFLHIFDEKFIDFLCILR